MYAKDLNEPKYQFLIKKCKDAGIKHLNDTKAFIKYSAYIDDFYNNINDYNPTRKRKNLIVFGDMNADIMTNKKFQVIVKEVLIRCRKLNIFLAFITQSYFFVSKNFYTLLHNKSHNKKDLPQIAINHSADIDYKDFMKIYKKCTSEPYSFFTIDTTIPANNPLRFKKSISDSLRK